MPRLRLFSPWFAALLALVLETTFWTFLLSHAFASGPGDFTRWIERNTSLIPTPAAAEAIGRGIDMVGVLAVIGFVVLVALRALRWTQGAGSDAEAALRSRRDRSTLSIYGDKPGHVLRRRANAILRPRAMASADRGPVLSALREELLAAGADPEKVDSALGDDFPFSVEIREPEGLGGVGPHLLGERAERSGPAARRKGLALERAVDRVFGGAFRVRLRDGSGTSFRSCEKVLASEGYTVLRSGSMMRGVDLPVSPSGEQTVRAVTTSPLSPTLLVIPRQGGGNAEALWVELALTATWMYSASLSGAPIDEASKSLDEVSVRAAAVGFSLDGLPGGSSPEEIRAHVLRAVATILTEEGREPSGDRPNPSALVELGD